MECSPTGSSVCGILQARILELPCSPSGVLPKPGIKPESLMSPALTGRFFTINTTWETRARFFFCMDHIMLGVIDNSKMLTEVPYSGVFFLLFCFFSFDCPTQYMGS